MEVAAAEGPAVLSALFAGLFANEQSSIYIGGARPDRLGWAKIKKIAEPVKQERLSGLIESVQICWQSAA